MGWKGFGVSENVWMLIIIATGRKTAKTVGAFEMNSCNQTGEIIK